MTFWLSLFLAATPAERLDAALEAYARDGNRGALELVLTREADTEKASPAPLLITAELALGRGALAEAVTALAAAEARGAPVAAERVALERAAKHPPGKARDALLYDAWLRRAERAIATGDFPAAIAAAQRAKAGVPVRGEADLLLGLCAEALDDPARALGHYGYALARLEGAERQAVPIERLKVVSNLRAADLEERTAARALGAGRDVEAAWATLRAFELDPTRGQAGVDAAALLLAIGQKNAAKDVWARVAQSSEPSVKAVVAELRTRLPSLGAPAPFSLPEWEAALAPMATGDWAAAERLLQPLTRAHPDVPRLALALATAQAAQSKLDVALKTLSDVGDGVPAVHAARAELLLLKKKPRESLTEADRAVALEPSRGRHLRVQAAALTALGKTPEAVEALTRATVLAPDDVVAWARLAEALMTVDPARATAVADKAVLVAPWHPEPYLARAALRFRAGEKDAAKEDTALAARLSLVGKSLREPLGGQPL